MKKIYIALLIALAFSNLFSQNKIDPPKLQNYNNPLVFDRDWNNTHFIRGWNWGSPKIIINSQLSIIN